MIGKTLRHYQIICQLGKGGMGEVFLADDLSLNRKVAVKFLPDLFTGDPERMARFEREAKLLASLNHPNIAGIHGIEEAEGKRFFVLELVEGKTLEEKVRKGPLSLEDTLSICRQIADGLEAAHEKGITHRDLKPANVMITAEDKVKILDFGLAKALSTEMLNVDSSKSPTITEVMTQPGVILGTASYMSPEQVKAKAVDRRTDIWALGCILYECLTGKRAFAGETIAETLAAILKNEPDWRLLPAKVPPDIRSVLRRCLEKDASRRFHDAADLGIEIEETPSAEEAVIPATRRLWPAWTVASTFILAFAAVSIMYLRQRPSGPAEPTRFEIMLPNKVNATSIGFAISPDGKHLAFAAAGSDGVTRIWIRGRNSLETRPLAGTESSEPGQFFWSPDSSSIAFGGEGKLKRINISGGPAQNLCDLSSAPCGGAWTRNGQIIFGSLDDNVLMRVPAEGGKPTRLTELNARRQELFHLYPVLLPDERHFLYLCLSGIPESQGIYVGSLNPGGQKESRKILASAHQPIYVPSQSPGQGWLLFLRDRVLMVQLFDDKDLKLIGEPVPVAEQVGSALHYGYFSASTNDILIYRTGHYSFQPILFDRQGERLSTAGEPGVYFRLALSPEGTRAAIGLRMPPSMLSDVWLLDLFRNTSSRFTYGKMDWMRPVWSPDGKRIAFSAQAGFALCQKPLAGTKEEELLLKSAEVKYPTSWSSNGRFIVYTAINPKTKQDLRVLSMASKQDVPLLNTEYNESDGFFSPDMHWMAYVSDESGRDEVYVREFSPASAEPSLTVGTKWLVSEGGGRGPRWRGDGKELYYRAPDGRVMAIGIDAESTFQATMPKALFQAPPSEAATSASAAPSPVWDVTKDGLRFLLATPMPENPPSPFTVILNWTSLLKK